MRIRGNGDGDGAGDGYGSGYGCGDVDGARYINDRGCGMDGAEGGSGQSFGASYSYGGGNWAVAMFNPYPEDLKASIAYAVLLNN